jgi:hypothetical protein
MRLLQGEQRGLRRLATVVDALTAGSWLGLATVLVSLQACSGDDGAAGWVPVRSDGGDASAQPDQHGGIEGGDADGADGSAGAAGESGADSASEGDGAHVDAPGEAASGLTSCVEVAHIGDSLTYYTQDSLTAAYAKVGATVEINAYGGRAIKQKLTDDPMTGKQAADAIRAQGFTGCWVVALGTNDTANVAAGAWYTRVEAIDEMMNAIDPAGLASVMWVNTYTTMTTGYWANDNMNLWNEALIDAQAHWPNMKIHDWASEADDGNAPFADGIHHTSAGYEVRNASIAHALVSFFPGP